MRVLIAAMGSRGDVQPVLALATALRARGHESVVNAPPDFAAWAGELGVPFVASGQSAQEVLTEHAADMGANPLRMLGLVRKIIAAEMPGWFERTLEAARGFDAIVSAGQFAASSVAEKLGIPCFNVVYSPTMLRSAHHPPFVARLQGLPRWMNSLLWSLSDSMIHRMLAGPLNGAREKFGLARLDSIPRHLFAGGSAGTSSRPGVGAGLHAG